MLNEILDVKAELSSVIGSGSVRLKKLFTGYGVFSGDDMFGIWFNQHFYLRAKDDLAEYMISIGACRWTENCKMKMAKNNYYLVPDSFKRDKNNYQKVIVASINQIKAQKTQAKMEKVRRVRGLLNLSLTHERLLQKVNINSPIELYHIGAEVAFARIKKYFQKE